MLNKVIISGRLTRDPELRQTTTGTSVCSFSVACDRDYKPENGERETDFVDIVAWRGTGEFVSKWFGKGDQIIVDGRLQIRDWTDKDGNKRRSAEVVADNVYFAGSKKNRDDAQRSGIGSERSGSGASEAADRRYGDEGYGAWRDDDAPPPPELPPEAQAFARQWGVQVEDGEQF